MHTTAQGLRRYAKTTTAAFALVLLTLFVFVFAIPNKVEAVTYPAGTKTFGYYFGSPDGFCGSACNVSLPLGGVFLIDLRFMSSNPLGASGAIVCNTGGSFVAFHSIDTLVQYDSIWDGCTNWDLYGNGTDEIWLYGHYLEYDPSQTSSTTPLIVQDAGDLKFALAIIITFMFLAFVTFVFNRTFKRKY